MVQMALMAIVCVVLLALIFLLLLTPFALFQIPELLNVGMNPLLFAAGNAVANVLTSVAMILSAIFHYNYILLLSTAAKVVMICIVKSHNLVE